MLFRKNRATGPRGPIRSESRALEFRIPMGLVRSYITSALVCGRNPKLVAAELGHATSQMVISNYDSFLDPRTWPDAEEIDRLRAVYGRNAVEDSSFVAPLGHPLGANDGAHEDGRSEVIETSRSFGAPGGIRTPDPQVRRRRSGAGARSRAPRAADFVLPCALLNRQVPTKSPRSLGRSAILPWIAGDGWDSPEARCRLD